MSGYGLPHLDDRSGAGMAVGLIAVVDGNPETRDAAILAAEARSHRSGTQRQARGARGAEARKIIGAGIRCEAARGRSPADLLLLARSEVVDLLVVGPLRPEPAEAVDARSTVEMLLDGPPAVAESDRGCHDASPRRPSRAQLVGAEQDGARGSARGRSRCGGSKKEATGLPRAARADDEEIDARPECTQGISCLGGADLDPRRHAGCPGRQREPEPAATWPGSRRLSLRPARAARSARRLERDRRWRRERRGVRPRHPRDRRSQLERRQTFRAVLESERRPARGAGFSR